MKTIDCIYCRGKGCLDCNYCGVFLSAYGRKYRYTDEQKEMFVPRIRFRLYHKPHFININLVHSDGYLEHVANIPIL